MSIFKILKNQVFSKISRTNSVLSAENATPKTECVNFPKTTHSNATNILIYQQKIIIKTTRLSR